VLGHNPLLAVAVGVVGGVVIGVLVDSGLRQFTHRPPTEPANAEPEAEEPARTAG